MGGEESGGRGQVTRCSERKVGRSPRFQLHLAGHRCVSTATEGLKEKGDFSLGFLGEEMWGSGREGRNSFPLIQWKTWRIMWNKENLSLNNKDQHVNLQEKQREEEKRRHLGSMQKAI